MTTTPSPDSAELGAHERANGDRRFTVGLVLDVRQVLIDHGYPIPYGAATGELMLALFRCLYPEDRRSQP